ncbi:MAG: hypothetical protein V1918_01495 [Planctomycetota bacterium]
MLSPIPSVRILLEAEEAEEIESPVSIADDVPDASKGRCCYLGPEKVNEKPETAQYKKGYPGAEHPGYARLSFLAPETADYTVWVRVRWSDDCGDSLDVAVDDAFWGTVQGNASKYEPRWIWLRVGSPRMPLTRRFIKGTRHVLALCNREDDLYFDQVLLVDAGYDVDPVGIERP